MLSRRRVNTGIVGTMLAMATAAPQPASAAPAQQKPRRMIVDAQVHIWTANTPELPWVPGVTPPGSPEPFTIERLLALMDEAGVDRAVIVPPTLTGYRNDYGIEAANRHPDRFA